MTNIQTDMTGGLRKKQFNWAVRSDFNIRLLIMRNCKRVKVLKDQADYGPARLATVTNGEFPQLGIATLGVMRRAGTNIGTQIPLSIPFVIASLKPTNGTRTNQ